MRKSQAMKAALPALLALTLAFTAFTSTCYGEDPMPSVYSKKVSGFKTVVFYYGWLDTSNLEDLCFDVLVFSGATGSAKQHMIPVLNNLRSKNPRLEVYAYLHDGDSPVGMRSSFNDNGSDTDIWVDYVTRVIDELVENYTSGGNRLIDGVFLDECDLGVTDPSDPRLQNFSNGLNQIVDYARSKGLKVFINGVRAYASLGDYYLWESFVAICQDSSYQLDAQFFSTSSTNPYEWTNGIAKYNYLRQNSLLGKTIALSYADEEHVENAKYGYYMARILGLAGWAFSPKLVYAQGGDVIRLDVYEVGVPISSPILNYAGKNATRTFTSGEVVVDLAAPSLKIPFQYVYYEIEGRPPSQSALTSDDVKPGANSNIVSYAYASTPKGLYVYLKATGTSVTCFHIYINYDGDNSTGYGPSWLEDFGAEYMVEAMSDGSFAGLYKYTGSGVDWSWALLSSNISFNLTSTGSTYELELIIPASVQGNDIYEEKSSKLNIAVNVNWNDDFYLRHNKLIEPKPTAPTIYDEEDLFANYIARVTEMLVEKSYAAAFTDAPSTIASGLANYTICVPYPSISKVTKFGSALQKMDTPTFSGEGYYVEPHDNFSKVTVVVKHSSPVTIMVYKGPSTVGFGGVFEPISLAHQITMSALIFMLMPLSIALIRRLLKSPPPLQRRS
ncbi:MAG: hypothetical protein DRJ31_02645 [Candidatus Methanomethylicota archaeon]|uniref:Uncharacterized protein n=1 Tax=Thermoproteota archaeon TaxID=2056631 RepID=A0A497ETL3_9CREN|nr:MAG: hypothetical protein DRJ31_02645 [Candidatus Verstraetearchaeota archaeon]